MVQIPGKVAGKDKPQHCADLSRGRAPQIYFRTVWGAGKSDSSGVHALLSVVMACSSEGRLAELAAALKVSYVGVAACEIGAVGECLAFTCAIAASMDVKSEIAFLASVKRTSAARKCLSI